MAAIASLCNLICIESPVTVHTILAKPKTFFDWLRNGWKPRQLENNLRLFKPVALVPYSIAEKYIILRMLNKLVLYCFIKFTIEPYIKRPVILMLGHPMQRHFVGLFKETLLCYEITDANDKLATASKRQNKRMEKIDNRLVSQADIVFTSSSNLKNEKQCYNRNIYFFPNAADVKLFSRSLDTSLKIPDDLAQIAIPRIGLIGHITENVDLELLSMMAEARPKWSIVLIGQIKGNSVFRKNSLIKRLKSCSNVYFLGLKPYELLPAYQKGLDVCLLPYKLNEYNNYISPNKIHQHFAGGKPIVSTDLPEVRRFNGLISLAKSREEFIEKVEKTLGDGCNNTDLVNKRLHCAGENSVEKRAKDRIDHLEMETKQAFVVYKLDQDDERKV